MYSLANESLNISILDPIADRRHFGTRYCTGGYVLQIDDAKLGPLLSGAEYPGPFIPFNGQGMPEAFNLSPLRENASTSPNALIIGIGLCDLDKDEVLEFCTWEVEQAPSATVMRTSQAYQGYALVLERAIILNNRTVRSFTRVKNTGKSFFPIRWFPHPFYPQPATDELCRFNFPVTIPENSGYRLAPSGFIARENWPEKGGFYLPLDHAMHSPLTVLQKHPVLGLVGGSTSYVPSFFPIWGNHNTFSWEPFFERTLAPNQSAAWWIDYDF
jgi:hypothetical protein